MKSKKQNIDYIKVREILKRYSQDFDVPIENNEVLTQKLIKAYSQENISVFLKKLDETCLKNQMVKMKIFYKILHLLHSPKKTDYRFPSNKPTKTKLRKLAKDFEWFKSFFKSGEKIQIGAHENKHEIIPNLEITFELLKSCASSEHRDVSRKQTRGTKSVDIYRLDVLKLFLCLVIDLENKPGTACAIISILISTLTGDLTQASIEKISNLKRIVSEESHHYLSLKISKQFRQKRRNP